MKLQLTAWILVAMASEGLAQSTPATVDIYINSRDDSGRLLGPGRPMASDIFQKIGVRLNWHTGAARSGQNPFAIRMVDHAPESATLDALASSRLMGTSGVEITVYKDRLRYFLDGHRSLAGVAVGYVLAHELAHAMQGVPRHSESGILRAHWSDQDFKEMVFHKLAFAPSDVELIHRGLVAQVAGRQ